MSIKRRIIIYFYIFILFYTIFLSYNYSDHICISLVIPSTYFSWIKCRKQIEYMLCNSVELPAEVIIVISGYNCTRKQYYFMHCNYRINLYYRKEKKNSASNKNYGLQLSKCSYVSFFDSDDIMSKDRIKILHYIINYYRSYDIILHMYTKQLKLILNEKYCYKNITKYFYLNSSYITYLYKKNIKKHKVQLWGCCNFLPIQYHISNGWITAKKRMLNLEKFNDDKSIQRAEDSEYNGRVISKGYKALILTIVLGYYSKRNECNIL